MKFLQVGKKRFLGSDPVTAFINVASLVSDFFTTWGFIESQINKIKDKKKMDADGEEKEDCSSGIEGLQSKIEELGKGIKQVICRLDAVHLKSSSYNQECSEYIKPYHASKKTFNNKATKPAAIHQTSIQFTKGLKNIP